MEVIRIDVMGHTWRPQQLLKQLTLTLQDNYGILTQKLQLWPTFAFLPYQRKIKFLSSAMVTPGILVQEVEQLVPKL